MHKHVYKGSMLEVFEHEFVFEVVENPLDERAFEQKNFLLERQQNVFHGAFNSRNYFQSSRHQAKKQIFADITPLSERSFHICCHLRRYRPIVRVAFRKFCVH